MRRLGRRPGRTPRSPGAGPALESPSLATSRNLAGVPDLDTALEQLQASKALLMGRHTYDAYASSWPNRDGVLAETINSMPKYVASTTLDKADWNNTTVIKGDLVAEVAKLKQQGGDILVHGFGPVANTLITNGLLDVLHLWVHPHFAGVGGPGDLLLNQGNNTRLELLGTRILKSGIVLLSYSTTPGA